MVRITQYMDTFVMIVGFPVVMAECPLKERKYSLSLVRNNANRQHEFVDILVIALCGMLSAADDWVSIVEYGEAKKDWYKK